MRASPLEISAQTPSPRSSVRDEEWAVATVVQERIPLFVVLDDGSPMSDWVAALSAPLGRVLRVRTVAEAAAITRPSIVDVIVLVEATGDARAWLAELREVGALAAGGPRLVVITDRPVDYASVENVAHCLPLRTTATDAQRVLTSAATRHVSVDHALLPPADAESARSVAQAWECSRALATQSTLRGVASACDEAITTLVECDRARCLFHDPNSGTLWAEGPDEEPDHRASVGLAGFVAVTGSALRLEQVGADARFLQTADDPLGDRADRWLAVPVVGQDRMVHAVLIATRSASARPFESADEELLAHFAAHAAPFMEQLSMQVEVRALLRADAGQPSRFRQAAVEAHGSGDLHGDVVRISPAWIDRAYYVVLAAALAALLFIVLGRVSQYSSGPAVIRVADRLDLTAQTSGNVTAVRVAPGQAVRRGQVLLELHDQEEREALARREVEYARQLQRRMLLPSDPSAGESVRQLRQELGAARIALDARRVRAPRDGYVSDVRVHAGQHLAPGDVVVSLVGERDELTLIALLPGSDRPRMRAGMPMRIQLKGFRNAYVHLTVDSVSAQVVGPAEARRFLGGQVGDALSVDGPVALVHARLPSSSFAVDGRRYDYHDGMPAEAELRIRTESIAATLFPWIERLGARDD